MPLITVQYATPQPARAKAEAIAKAVNQLSAEVLRKDPNVTAIITEEVKPSHWFVADRTLAQHGLASFWIDIRIVEGTNTREEKAAFVAAAFARMQELLGPLHGESYVHVNEVRGDAYGYGGVTQNERYIAGRLKALGKAALEG
ncbi:4-oxalocrotonate tautomerase family protein [Chelativorans sp.]|uniref:tautomerase family protein n=1 Tax=Chelativorans sp. TaxID=2203393 RepID=UPI0028123CED|nr:4-oxalocrotonate tautomerase family protein [Chelativorans sp.]